MSGGILARWAITIPIISVAALAAGVPDHMPWTTVGSAGAIEPQTLASADVLGEALTVDGAAPPKAFVVASYNVTPAPGLYRSSCKVLTVTYLDRGSNERVRVYLTEVDHGSGTTQTRMAFDSDAFPPSSQVQQQTILTAKYPGWEFNFDASSFYLEAWLDKQSGTTDSAQLVSMRLWSTSY